MSSNAKRIAEINAEIESLRSANVDEVIATLTNGVIDLSAEACKPSQDRNARIIELQAERDALL